MKDLNSSGVVHSIDTRLDQIVEATIAQLQDGQSLDVESLAAAHPEYARQLRELLPMVATMVRLSETTLEGQVQSSFPIPPPPEAEMDLADQPQQQLGDFRILRELGRGGMGVVYEAEQLSLGRHVALKVLPFAAMLDRQQLARFKNEARAAATLDHPHIVAIYSVGCERSVHFYAMQLIEGRSVAEIIAAMKSGRPPSVEETAPTAALIKPPTADDTARAALPTVQATGSAAVLSIPPIKSREFYRSVTRLGMQAAAALDHAHRNGILHRDIKPANLLVDDTGKLWITDFGLARIEADAGMTMTGDVLGTLRYMSPEQAVANRILIDHRCDIYSLGATLYELLTLQPAFADTDRAKLLQHIAHDDPQEPRKIDERIPVDLGTIVLKAMAKQREDRYQTAEQLGEDLRAYLEGRPIRAKPPGFIHRTAKWSRRHQSLVAITGIALALLLLLVTISMVFVKRSEHRAITALRETSGLLYEADMSLAYLAFEKGRSDEAERILAHHQPAKTGSASRGFEWYLLHSAVRKPAFFTLAGHEGSVNEIAAFPDGRRIVSVGDDGTLCIWDLESRELTQKLQLGAEPLHSVAVSPDGRFVAAGSKAIYLCDLTQGGKANKIFRSEHNFEALAFHADGSRLAAGSRYHDVFLLTLAGELVGRTACGSCVQSLEFISKERLLLFPNRIPESPAGGVEVAQFWRDDLSFVQEQIDCIADYGNVNVTVARSLPDGQHVLVGDRYKRRAHLVNRASGKVVSSAGNARCQISDLAVAPDGGKAAISYVDGTVEYRQLKSHRGSVSFCELPRLFQAHRGETHAVRFVTADRLATCGADGLINVWTMSDLSERAYDLSESDDFQSVRMSPDGSLLLYTGANSLSIARSLNGRVLWTIGKTAAPDPLLTWSPTGNRFAVCLSSSHERRFRIFNRIGQHVSEIEPSGDPRGVAFSPSDQLVAIISTQQLQLCNTESGEEITQRSGAGYGLAFSHDGKWLAYGGDDDRVYICDVPGLLTRRALVAERDVRSLAYSPDDQVLAAGHDDGTIRLWNTTTGQMRAEMTGHEREVKDLAFSPDGRTLLSCDGVIRIWSVDHARSYGSFYDTANCMSLSADGRRLTVGVRPTTEIEADVRLWDLQQMSLDR